MRPACSIALATFLLVFAGHPAHAQEEDSPLPDRIERALREMLQSAKPTLEEALDYMRSFGAIDDPRHYELPELLPNGDIIIRRREDAPELRPEAPEAAPDEDPPYDPDEGIRT